MGIAEELQKLESLRASGAITDAEFTAAKARVLDGQPAANSPPVQADFLQHLTRSSTDRWFGGVCGGLGQCTTVPSWAWRMIFVILLLSFGVGLVPYIVMWIFIPLDQQQT